MKHSTVWWMLTMLACLGGLGTATLADDPVDSPDPPVRQVEPAGEDTSADTAEAPEDASTEPDNEAEPADEPAPGEGIDPGTEEQETPPTTTAPAAKTDLDGCRDLYRKGQYTKAIEGYRALASTPGPSQIPAVIGLAESLRMVGRYSEAVTALEAVATAGGKDPTWLAASAESLASVGRYRPALEAAAQAGRLAPTDPEIILLEGRLLEVLGRREQALDAYGRMSGAVETDDYLRSAPQLVALGLILDRIATLSGRKASDQASNVLHNYLQKAYQTADKTYWPAHIAAGDFLLAKHKAREASKEYSLALKLNKRIPDMWAGVAAMQLGQWRFEKALENAGKALKINPHHPGALYAQAAVYMQWRKFEKVPPLLEKVLAINPHHPDALSLMATAWLRMDEPDKAEPYMKRLAEVDPNCPILPATIGQWMVAARRFDQAEGYLKRAIELAPNQAGPMAELGKMYMQTGQEELAVTALERAHELDDFRSDVVNYLNIARRLTNDKLFATKETEHFIVKVSRQHDLVLLDQIADYMESIYEEVCTDYDHEPAEKTIIEVLPFQKQFSARITGRSWIPTVGACTGRVIAIAAPHRKRGKLGRHNWAQVLRHEFAHVVTLSVTHNRTPHWFTEACAVWQQKDKRAFKYVHALAMATRQDGLLPIEDIDWGFIRPKTPGQRMLAYAQSEWMMEYIIQTQGFGKIHEMLKAFGAGETQDEVLRDVLGTNAKEFDKQFRLWAIQQATAWGFDLEPLPKADETKKALDKAPDDPQMLARYALALYITGKRGDALKHAEKALELDPQNVYALRVLAVVALAKKDHDKAIEYARRIETLDQTTRTAPRVLAEALVAKAEKNPHQFAGEAIEALELLQKRQPLDDLSYKQLAKMYVQLGQPDKALPNLIYLHRHTMDDPKYARQVAEIYRGQRQNDVALEWFREVTYINPYEPNAHQGIASIYVRKKDYDHALQTAEYLTLLEPTKGDSWSYLATVRFRAGRAAKNADMLRQARSEAEKAKELDPSGQADQIIQYIDMALEQIGT